MRPKLLFLAAAFGLAAGSLLAQIGSPPQAKPSPKAEVVRVRTGSYAGMCIGWCDTVTSIDSRSIQTVTTSPGDPKNYPQQKTISRITAKQWREVQGSIDATVLAAMDEHTGCAGCADEMVQWVEVQFRDGTKKGIAYNAGTDPLAISDLMKKLVAIETSTARPLK